MSNSTSILGALARWVLVAAIVFGAPSAGIAATLPARGLQEELGLDAVRYADLMFTLDLTGGASQERIAGLKALKKLGWLDEAVTPDEGAGSAREADAGLDDAPPEGREAGEVEVVVHPDWGTHAAAGQYMEVYVQDPAGNRRWQWSDWVSTGRPGKPTPRGHFKVLRMDQFHHSSTYGNSPMFQYLQLGAAWGEHETPHETFLGRSASMGCLRTSREASLKLWALALAVGKPHMTVNLLGTDQAREHVPAGTPPFVTYKAWNARYYWTSGTAFPERMSQAEKARLEDHWQAIQPPEIRAARDQRR